MTAEPALEQPPSHYRQPRTSSLGSRVRRDAAEPRGPTRSARARGACAVAPSAGDGARAPRRRPLASGSRLSSRARASPPPQAHARPAAVLSFSQGALRSASSLCKPSCSSSASRSARTRHRAHAAAAKLRAHRSSNPLAHHADLPPFAFTAQASQGCWRLLAPACLVCKLLFRAAPFRRGISRAARRRACGRSRRRGLPSPFRGPRSPTEELPQLVSHDARSPALPAARRRRLNRERRSRFSPRLTHGALDLDPTARA